MRAPGKEKPVIPGHSHDDRGAEDGVGHVVAVRAAVGTVAVREVHGGAAPGAEPAVPFPVHHLESRTRRMEEGFSPQGPEFPQSHRLVPGGRHFVPGVFSPGEASPGGRKDARDRQPFPEEEFLLRRREGERGFRFYEQKILVKEQPFASRAGERHNRASNVGIFLSLPGAAGDSASGNLTVPRWNRRKYYIPKRRAPGICSGGILFGPGTARRYFFFPCFGGGPCLGGGAFGLPFPGPPGPFGGGP